MGLRCEELGHILKVVGDNYVCDRCKGWMSRKGGRWYEYVPEKVATPPVKSGASSPAPSSAKSYSRPPRGAAPSKSVEPVKDSSEWPPYLRSYEKLTDDQLKNAALELLDHKLYRPDKFTAMIEDIASKSHALSQKQRIALANHLRFHEKDF